MLNWLIERQENALARRLEKSVQDIMSAEFDDTALERFVSDFTEALERRDVARALDLFDCGKKPDQFVFHALQIAFQFEDQDESFKPFTDDLLALSLLCLNEKGFVETGELLFRMGIHHAAKKMFLLARAINPQYEPALIDLGVVYQRIGAPHLGHQVLLEALAVNPGNAVCLNNLAAVLIDLGLHAAASEYARKALAIVPSFLSAHHNLATSLLMSGQFSEAADVFEHVLLIDQENLEVRSKAVSAHARLLNWEQVEYHLGELKEQLLSSEQPSAMSPFALLAVCDEPEVHRRAAERASTYLMQRDQGYVREWKRRPSRERRRLAYLSADFHDHPSSRLLLPLLAAHDPGRFELIAVSFGPIRDVPERSAIRSAVSDFVEINHLSDDEAISVLRDMHFDIAIDVNGHTAGARPRLFANRVAPLQVGFLGYPGTTGNPSIDIVIADEVTVPSGGDIWFSEEVRRLPFCYQPFSRNEVLTGRKSSLLPHNEDVVVLAAFHQSVKITSAFFHAWLEILRMVPNAVLWLQVDNPRVEDVIRAKARDAGLDPNRFLFSNRTAVDEYLRRFQSVDLFLDCAPYNAHTTCSDALKNLVPVLTVPGKSFASRVAASMLISLGLDDLVCPNLDAYVACAVGLARDKSLRERTVSRIAEAVKTRPYTDIKIYSQAFEALLE